VNVKRLELTQNARIIKRYKSTQIIIIQCRSVIRKPDIRKSGYKKGAGRVPAELLFEFSGYKKIGYKKVRL
jgi:hypothetical protein